MFASKDAILSCRYVSPFVFLVDQSVNNCFSKCSAVKYAARRSRVLLTLKQIFEVLTLSALVSSNNCLSND
jgi:hypothetical protein